MKKAPEATEHETMTQVFRVQDLTPHKIFDKLKQPEMAEDSEAFAALVESIREHGVTQPPVVTEKGEIMDGRNRVRAARVAGRKKLTCTLRDGDEAADIIAANLINRRHYSKAALAYIFLPMAMECTESGKAARGPVTVNKTDRSVLNLAKYSKMIGVSTDTFQQAFTAHRMIEALSGKGFEGKTARDIVEEMLFVKLMGYKQVLAFLASVANNDRHAAACARGARSDYAKYIERSFKSMQATLEKWSKIPSDVREEILGEVPEVVVKWPKEFRAVVIKAISGVRD